jgi:hypothetical protein
MSIWILIIYSVFNPTCSVVETYNTQKECDHVLQTMLANAESRSGSRIKGICIEVNQ